jgi:hypothetical protein
MRIVDVNDLPPDTIIHVAGNGHVLTVGSCQEIIGQIEHDPTAAAPDAIRLIRYLMFVCGGTTTE